MLVGLIAIEAVVMICAPVLLGQTLRRRLGTTWSLFGIGAVTFVASQVVHVPLNVGLTALFAQEWMPKPPEAWRAPFNALVLGLTAGLCEEVARYLVLRLWAKEARSWRQALMFGAGHGGVESIILGAVVVAGLFTMSVLRDMDISTLGLSPEQAALLADQVAEFWSTPWYMPFLALAERLMAILLHLSLAALVLQALIRARLWPLWAAIAWHMAVDAVAVYVNLTWGGVASEGVLALLSVGSAGILWVTWRAGQRQVLGQEVGS
jgi:uncharacterized membrane protein YhfC